MKPKQGKVIIAGAGPGDPELLTLKAVRWLQEADVVITDRLVSEEILERFVRKDALVLHAGKQRNREGSTPQLLINELLVHYAEQGHLVLRLKGGDVSIFSNILDELLSLVEHGIPYEIVPGITAASGAAAYAGIPLTARDHANALRILTFYERAGESGLDWKDLAQTSDTLIFYMSAENLDLLIDQLIQAGIDKTKWISVIEQATTPLQQVRSATLEDYALKLAGKKLVSPTLVIIGKVAGLQEQFQWRPNNETEESYFRPLEKKKHREARA